MTGSTRLHTLGDTLLDLPGVRGRLATGQSALAEVAAWNSAQVSASQGATVIKEATASTFVFRRDPGGTWWTALVWHPRLECWMLSGGHVEIDESAAGAAQREAREGTGLDVRLLPGPAVPVPAGFPHETVCAPWWMVEMRARADNHKREPHVHLDHVFLALASDDSPVAVAAHEARWFTELETGQAADISEDSRLQAAELFRRITEMAAAALI